MQPTFIPAPPPDPTYIPTPAQRAQDDLLPQAIADAIEATGGSGHGSDNDDVAASSVDFAIYLASQGTSGVNQVYPIAVAGTNYDNLIATWIGTINSELAGAVSGSLDPSARAGVLQVEAIANQGTNFAFQAISGANFGIYLAGQGTNGVNQVYPIAVAGTTVANLDAAWIGTINTQVALDTLWIGTLNANTAFPVDASARAGVGQVEQIANSGTSGANFGIYLASQGTNGVNQVFPIAVAGTTVANLDASWIGTLNITDALELAWIGTLNTQVALDTSWIGTLNTTVAGLSSGNVDSSARAGVLQVEQIANSGTSGANFAIFLAGQGTNGVNQVYPIAVAGTTVANLDAAWIGTLNTEVNNALNWIGTVSTIANAGSVVALLDAAWIGTLNTQVALDTTWIGTLNANTAFPVDASARAGVGQVEQIANSGTSGANFAIFLAGQGTNGVNQVFPIAVAGTTVANLDAAWIGTLNTEVGLLNTWMGTVSTIANAGSVVALLDTQWIGTLNTQVALDTTWIGTLNANTAFPVDASARAGVGQVEQIANSGTSGANFAIFLAGQGTNGVNQVYPIAVAGTTVANLDSNWIGTLNTNVGLLNTWMGTVSTIANAGSVVALLDAAWIGTLNTQVALDTFWIGTLNTTVAGFGGGSADLSARAGVAQAIFIATEGTSGVNQVYPIANSGTSGANFGIYLASQGTSGVNQVYPIAVAGTTVANLVAAWIGTLNTTDALELAWIGTLNTQVALDTSWIGTNAAIAVAGTNQTATLFNWWGTLASAYGENTLTSNGTVTVCTTKGSWFAVKGSWTPGKFLNSTFSFGTQIVPGIKAAYDVGCAVCATIQSGTTFELGLFHNGTVIPQKLIDFRMGGTTVMTVPAFIHAIEPFLAGDTCEVRVRSTLTSFGTIVFNDATLWMASIGAAPTNTPQLLTSNLTYYVAKNGNDSNTGLTANTPFLTIAQASNSAAALVTGPYQVTIQIGDGTYAEVISPPSMNGALALLYQGNVSAAANVVIAPVGHSAVKPQVASTTTMQYLSLSPTSGNNAGIAAFGQCYITASNIIWGASGGQGAFAQYGGYVALTGTHTITTNMSVWLNSNSHGVITLIGATVFTPSHITMANEFAATDYNGYIESNTSIFMNAANVTATKFLNNHNSIMFVGGNTAFWPGNAAGTTANGSLYL